MFQGPPHLLRTLQDPELKLTFIFFLLKTIPNFHKFKFQKPGSNLIIIYERHSMIRTVLKSTQGLIQDKVVEGNVFCR
jgi:hypothetical protein